MKNILAMGICYCIGGGGSSTPPAPVEVPEASTMADATVQKSRQIEMDKAAGSTGTGATMLTDPSETDEGMKMTRADHLYGDSDRKKHKLGAA